MKSLSAPAALRSSSSGAASPRALTVISVPAPGTGGNPPAAQAIARAAIARGRKRRETNDLMPAVAVEIAAAYPRWQRSSERAADRCGASRLAVVDTAMAELERRVRTLEAAVLRRAA